jgi:hypothetical protein
MIKLYDDYTINVMTSQGPGRLYGIDKNKVLVEHDYKYLVEYAPELVGNTERKSCTLGPEYVFWLFRSFVNDRAGEGNKNRQPEISSKKEGKKLCR